MMEEGLKDGEFWLPPQFLSEGDLFMDFKKTKSTTPLSNNLFSNGGDRNNGGYEFLYGLGSDLSSPVESVMSSAEAESEEDDFFSGLTRKLAQSTLSDDLWKACYGNTKTWGMAKSPQSTLCNVMGSGCGCKGGSSHGSPNCPSPPAAATSRNEAAWDLLYAAAGKVAKMRMVEEAAAGFYGATPQFGPPRKPSPISVQGVEFHSDEPLTYHQLQAKQFHQLRQQQVMKQVWGQQQKSFGTNLQAQQTVQRSTARNCNNGPGLFTNAWPTLQESQHLQQQEGFGTRTVFVGNPGHKRERSGTGVFIPRRVGTPAETVKKPGCSVLLPDKVIQALNLNLEAMDGHPRLQRSNKSGVTPDYYAALEYRNNVVLAQARQRRNAIRPQPVPMNNELRLPQEWTY